MSVRDEQENWEEQFLAPYAIRSIDSGGREYPEQDQQFRTEFQRDRDRVVFSNAFRRMMYKTQVFPNHEGDHFRTRLTHTIEVANLSRNLARSLRLNEDFTECLALVHDIGHPPFGHCGEEVLHQLMKGKGGFEHNEQTHRLVTVLEKRYPGFDGLNLTLSVREALLQHTAGYKKRYPDSKPALLETHLVSIADEIIYDCHDVEDGLASGLLQEQDFSELELWREVFEQTKFDQEKSTEVRRRTMARKLINAMVMDLHQNSKEQLDQADFKSAEEARLGAEKLLNFTEAMKKKKRDLELWLHKHMYRHPKVLRMRNKSRYFMERLFEHFCRYPKEMPLRFQERMNDDGLERCVTDYISGMTDRYLQEEYQKVFMPFQKML